MIRASHHNAVVIERVTRNLAVLGIVSYLFRSVLLIGIYFAFDGKEYTDDIQFHLKLVADPFYYFMCGHADWSQQPPLLGLVETSLLPFTHVFGAFFGPRLAYAAWDIAGSLVLIRALAKQGWDTPLIRLLLLFGPLNIYASVVSAQDETITYCFACICGALILRGREHWSFVFACFSVVAGKVLFLPFALALAPTVLSRGRWAYFVAGGAILSVTYAWSSICDYSASKFVLPAVHTINFWQVLADDPSWDWNWRFRISLAAMIAVASVQLAFAALRRRSDQDGRLRLALPDPILTGLIVVLAFLGFFYHVVPEYFLILVPFLVIFLHRFRASGGLLLCLVTALLAAPIIPDVLRYFVRHQLGPDWMRAVHVVSGILVSVLCLGASIGLQYLSRRESSAQA